MEGYNYTATQLELPRCDIDVYVIIYNIQRRLAVALSHKEFIKTLLYKKALQFIQKSFWLEISKDL